VSEGRAEEAATAAAQMWHAKCSCDAFMVEGGGWRVEASGLMVKVLGFKV
jgi:hypothetical protein